MTIKPFEIQGAQLKLGGVQLEAGTTGVVIPGVTQATNYKVEEVEDRDGNNPDTFGNDAEAISIIDNADYLFRTGAQTASGSYSAAGYSVDELEDGEIKEINVEVDGIFESADKAFAEAGNMWATTVSGAKDNFDANDWTQISFRPKIRAGEVENIGGGGGASALEDLEDVQIANITDGQALVWNEQREQWENQTISGGSGGTGAVVERSVEFPTGDTGDTRGTIALTPNGETYICVDDYQAPEETIFTVEHTTQDFGQGGPGVDQGQLVVDLTDYPELLSFALANPDLVGDGLISADGGDTWIDPFGYTGLSWEQNPPFLSLSFDGSAPTDGQEFLIKFAAITPAIWKRLVDITSDNGDSEFNISTPGDLTIEVTRPEDYDSEGDCDLNLYAADDVWIEAKGDEVGISANTNVSITTSSSSNNYEWQFGANGDLVLPEGKTIRDINGVDLLTEASSPQYGYFNELSHPGDNNQVEGKAVAVDGDNNSYVSYSYWNDSDNRDYGGVMKFDSTGEKLWSVDIASQNGSAEYPRIVSLEHVVAGGQPLLIAIGDYYDTNTSKSVGFMYAINPETGEVGLSPIDIETSSDTGMELNDAVFGLDGADAPFAVVVGETYDISLTKTLTPLAGSTVDKLYFSWSEINASGLNNGDQLFTNIGGYAGLTVNGGGGLASPTGTGEGMNLTVSSTEAGAYVITRVNGWSGVMSSWDVPVSLRVLGSNLGGVDNVKYTVTSDNISGNGSLYFVAADFADLANVQNGWRVSGPGITGSAILSNVQLAGGYYRFDVPNGVTVSPNESYTIIDNNGNDCTFDFDRTVFADNSDNMQAAISNIQGTPVSTVYCPAWNGRDWSTDIGNPVDFTFQLYNQAFVARFGSNAWSKSIGAGSYDTINSVVVDNGGNTYVVGGVSNGTRSSLVIKYAVDGEQLWAVYIDPANNMGNELYSIDILADGSLLTVDEDGVVTKLSSDTGEIFWQVKADTGPSWDGNFRGTATPDGDYIITNFEDNDYTQYVMRVSGSDGSSVWNKRITRTYDGNNGEINANSNSQYIDCNETYLTIAGRSQPPSGNTVGVVYSFPVTGENTDGTYGQFVISTESMEWSTLTTTSVAATVPETPTNIGTSNGSPTKNDVTITVNQTSIGGEVVTPPEVISWTNPNNNTWRIETYNGGAAVSYDGGDYDAKWFDIANHTSGSNDFRGAIIQYHAFVNNGTIIGTIHLSNDYPQQAATHTEHLSGGSNLQFVTLWECNNERNGQLFLKMTNGSSQNLMIQWTSTVFYGSEYNY